MHDTPFVDFMGFSEEKIAIEQVVVVVGTR